MYQRRLLRCECDSPTCILRLLRLCHPCQSAVHQCSAQQSSEQQAAIVTQKLALCEGHTAHRGSGASSEDSDSGGGGRGEDSGQLTQTANTQLALRHEPTRHKRAGGGRDGQPHRQLNSQRCTQRERIVRGRESVQLWANAWWVGRPVHEWFVLNRVSVSVASDRVRSFPSDEPPLGCDWPSRQRTERRCWRL